MKKLWFKAKTYGWGWQPSSWEGVVVVVVHLAITFAGVYIIFKNPAPIAQTVGLFVLLEFVITLILIIIAYKTGEKPQWRWGNEDK